MLAHFKRLSNQESNGRNPASQPNNRMTLDQFLKTKGHLGSRTKHALANRLIACGWTHVPEFASEHEQGVKNCVEHYFKTGHCNVHGLGKKGLLLLAQYFKIPIPKKNNSVSSLRQQLAKANKRIAELERKEFICKQCGLRKNAERIEADF